MLRKFYDAATPGAGGFDAATLMVVNKIDGLKEGLQGEIKAITEANSAYQVQIKELKDGIEAMKAAMPQAPDPTIQEAFKSQIDLMQKQIDALDLKAASFGAGGHGAVKDAYSEIKAGVEANKDNLAQLATKQVEAGFSIKADVMTTTNSLTGDGVITYNSRQALVPAQKINFRDMIPKTFSSTLEYVTFFEDPKVGAVANQTEGDEKATIEYNFTNVQKVQQYLAGTVTFSKQLMKSLPWLQNTLPRLLMRDFFLVENANFWTTAVAAATTYVANASDDVEATIEAIGYFASTNFTPSFGVVNPQQWAQLAISTYNKGYYGGAGSVVIEPGGMITIAGVPIISASWAANDKLLLIDRDYVELVSGEDINVTYSFENGTNFTKNLVTAKIEALEVLNVMRPDALLYMDYGNVT